MWLPNPEPRLSWTGRLQVAGRIHALMQDTDDGDAVTGQLEIDDMLLDTTSPIAWSDVGTALRLLRSFGQIGAGSFNEVGVAHRLGQTPVRHGIVENSIKGSVPAEGEMTP